MEHDWHASHEMFNTYDRPVTFPCIGRERETLRFLDQWEIEHGRSPSPRIVSSHLEEGTVSVRR